MNILAFDTSGNFCTVALSVKNKLYSESMPLTHGHAIHLMPLITKIMERANTNFNQLDLIGVVNGPGSFTGIRVGIATAHGLAIASKLPLVAVSTFELYAWEAQGLEILVIIDSRRNDLFAQMYDNEMHPLDEPRIIKPNEINESNPIVGNGLKLIDPEYAEIPSPQDLIDVVKYKWESGASTGLRQDCKPLYLREPDATIVKNSKL